MKKLMLLLVVILVSAVENVSVTSMPVEGCKTSYTDIVFLLDASASVGQANFAIQKQFVANFTQDCDIGPHAVQIGVVTFSSTVRKELDLNTYKSEEQLLRAIDRIGYMVGGTHTSAGLQYVRSHSFSPVAGDRPNAPNVLVLLTDGMSNHPVATRVEAQITRQQNIKVIAVGIGKYRDEFELRMIASAPKDVFSTDSFDALSGILDSLEREACIGATRKPPNTTVSKTTSQHSSNHTPEASLHSSKNGASQHVPDASIYPTSYWSSPKHTQKKEQTHLVICSIVGSILIVVLLLYKTVNHAEGNMNNKILPLEKSDILGNRKPGENVHIQKSLEF